MKYFLTFFIGIFSTWIAFRYYNNLIDTKQNECVIQLASLSTNLANFNKICGRLPTELEGLKVLSEPSLANCKAEPFIHDVGLDPWDGQITYIIRGKRAYLLSSKTVCGYQEIVP